MRPQGLCPNTLQAYIPRQMPRRALQFGPLAVIYGLLLVMPCHAQFPLVPKRCSPPSTLLSLSAGDNLDHSGKRPDATPGRRVIIERINFDGPIHLPDSVVTQIVADANQGDGWHAGNLDWLHALTEVGLKNAWQNLGYFRVKVAAEASSLGVDSSTERFLVTAHVDEGLQYHLGELQFVSTAPGDMQPFPESQLRDAFPLHEGDLFNLDPIRKGIEALTKLYSSQGYIDFTATPEMKVDDKLQRISLVMYLDEQKQFRVGSTEILGLDHGVEARLRLIIRVGEVFNPQPAYDFLKENQSLLPPGVSLDDLQARRNTKTGIVDVAFDARPCPPIN